jgi:hypothetical protein
VQPHAPHLILDTIDVVGTPGVNFAPAPANVAVLIATVRDLPVEGTN